MELTKWMAAAASIWIQSTCGTTYAFGIYSSVLKSTQHYDQSTLDTISVFKDIGSNAGVLSGLLYSAVCTPSAGVFRGPWVVHVAGAVQNFVGYFFLWLAVTGAISRPQVPLMCLFMFLAAHAQTFFNTANLVTAVHNFPAYNGTVVGIMMGFSGLSGAIIIQIYQLLFPGKPTTFLLMLALLPTLVSLTLMFIVRICHTKTSTQPPKPYLNAFSLISIILAAYVMFLIILENIIIPSPWMSGLAFTILILILSSPLHVAIKAQKPDHYNYKPSSPPSLKAPLIHTNESKNQIIEVDGSDKNIHKATILDAVGDDMNLVQAMRTSSFWLIFTAMMCGMGSGLATINNISQIGESLGYTTLERSTLVSLLSIWNFLGRFGAGFISDIFLHKRGWARPLFMAATLAAMTAGHTVIGSGFSGNLYVGSVVVGICYGAQWSLMPTIVSELFGVQHMGTIFSTIAIGSPLGSYIFSVKVIGYIYDMESGEDRSCVGSHCFMLSFFIMAGVSLFGFFMALVLLFKTRGVYARIVRTRMLA